jgi:Poly (ADP-ribose) glycohydrolase (PARG)
MFMELLYRRDYDAARLFRSVPLELDHKNKQFVFELAMSGDPPSGTISVSRWNAASLPTARTVTEFVPLPGYFDYAGPDAGVWHINFADPHLFFAYGSALLAQDELQCAEHPALGAIREALAAEHLAPLTEDEGIATPVLVANVERRVALTTRPTASNPVGLYGNAFSRADPSTIREAAHLQRPAPKSHIIAIAAPTGSGTYTRRQIEYAVTAAYTGFAAAVVESQRLWPGTPVEIRTGFWGCGAFGGNRELMTVVQLYAAELAGVARVKFYAFDDTGRADFEKGRAALSKDTSIDETGLPRLGSAAEGQRGVIDQLVARGYQWGFSNGT